MLQGLKVLADHAAGGNTDLVVSQTQFRHGQAAARHAQTAPQYVQTAPQRVQIAPQHDQTVPDRSGSSFHSPESAGPGLAWAVTIWPGLCQAWAGLGHFG